VTVLVNLISKKQNKKVKGERNLNSSERKEKRYQRRKQKRLDKRKSDYE
jgi:hypothetical protein